MTIELIKFPKFKLTLGVTEYENVLMENAKVIRNENGYDVATITLNDSTIFPATVTSGTAVKLEVGKKGSAYPANPMFKGVCKFPVIDIGVPTSLTLSCVGSGYGFGQMKVGTEYGATSTHTSNVDLSSIIEGPNYGILAKYVNKVLADANSGFSYTSSVLIQGDDPDIQYISFPYKPAAQCLNDLMDLITALRPDQIGSHWIVTSDDKLRVKQIGEDSVGWTTWYGGSDNDDGQATLTYGTSYKRANFEKIGPDANYILYYGAWRRPSNGDFWTENQSALWDCDANTTLSDDGATYIIDTYSLKANQDAVAGGTSTFYFPAGRNAAWDFTYFTEFNTPSINFYIRRSASVSNLKVLLSSFTGAVLDGSFYKDITSDVSSAGEFVHFSFPVGPYYNISKEYKTFQWTVDAAPDWSAIDAIQFAATMGEDVYVNVDGLHFGGAAVCRVAYDSNITPYNMALLTDNVGKDDTLTSDDSGVMARMAYAELMRQSTTAYAGWCELEGIIPEALPGQYFYLQETMRATKIVHIINEQGFNTTLYLTDDLTNGRARMRYEDLNRVYQDVRPEFQDRQATSIKAGTVDFNVPRIAVDYG